MYDFDKDWTKEQLMGRTMAQEEKECGKKLIGKGVKADPMLWGVPGHLTSEEADVFFRFKDAVETRGPDFKDTIYCFGEIEGEVWALCRWLRARKFDFDKVMEMIDEANQTRAEAKKMDFYPNPTDALGVDKSLFFAQFPQLYSGSAKNGSTLFFSKPGVLNVDGIQCLTTLNGIIEFHWYIMMHDFAQRLRAKKEADPENFKRFDCVCVLDLNKLTASQLTKKALAIIKAQAAIDGVCFPETMNKMLIINAPLFFAATWSIIKGWLDPRTAAKIEVISYKSAVEKRLLELVDADQLPSDYGGRGEDTESILAKSYEGSAKRLVTKMLYLRGHGSETVEVMSGESCEVAVSTRSLDGATFSLTNAATKQIYLDDIEVKHLGSDDDAEKPTMMTINEKHRVEGPCTLKVKADSKASRFSTQNMLLIFSFY